MKKRKFKIALIFGLLAILVFCAIGYLKKRENVLPEEGDILTMKATYYTLDGDDFEFTVEPEYFSLILNELRPAQRDYFQTAAWIILGNLRLSCKDERVIEVNLYFTPFPEGAFSINTAWGRNFYRGGNSSSLNDALETACKGSKDKKKIVHP